ncbi:MAG TPA: phosphodiester glycosidase family protein [Candidatus Caenarcaniphilales bacterium]
MKIPGKLRPHLSTLANPNRLLIDLRPDPPVAQRDILWAPGLRWREQVLSLGTDRYPVVWLAVNLREAGVKLQPIWNNPATLVGTAPLANIAQGWRAAAAINGGFFNRDKQLPLGAIRQNNRWLSSPILNRGAIAWSDQGEFKLGRLTLLESLTTSDGQRLNVLSLNSGYVQKGLVRYTRDWGSTYTPLTSNEILTVVQNNRVVSQQAGGSAGQITFTIPADGYLLITRGGNANPVLRTGTILRSETQATPTAFHRYPTILGAGPLLVHNRQIVLDTKAEQFRPPFERQFAPRSAIGQTVDGTTLIATIHNRVGGPGPTLQEMARLMQQLGAVEALNLDGGSSTALYLGGQLLDRHSSTAIRVHNGIGIFVQPSL